MTEHSDPPAVAELAGLIAAAVGEEGTGWAAGITAATSLHDDLELESIEVAALGTALRDRYGPTVELDAYLTGLDLDQLVELTVGDLAAYVARCRAGDFPDLSRS
ncbi:acyl carrier protein [Plantactinospora sp. WMMB334]|uniref:acyl carrier protein n=1 Tax=Plantactinospora sp. WMMB334 TaxID=3404119 RepID=UPI003B95377D